MSLPWHLAEFVQYVHQAPMAAGLSPAGTDMCRREDGCYDGSCIRYEQREDIEPVVIVSDNLRRKHSRKLEDGLWRRERGASARVQRGMRWGT